MALLPSIIAHRGASSYAPENTMASLELAYALGCTCIEVDIQLTADSIPVLFHDDKLARIFDINGSIQDYTYAELKEYDVGSWFNIAFEKSTILTLKEALEFGKQNNIRFDLELKEQGNAAKLCDLVLRTLQEVNFNNLVLSSFSKEVISILQKNTDIEVGLALHTIEDLGGIGDCKPNFLVVNHELISKSSMSKLCDVVDEIYVYVVNELSVWHEMEKIGVSGVFTDELKKF